MRSDLAAMHRLCAHLRDGGGAREGVDYLCARWRRGDLDLAGAALDEAAAGRLADALLGDRTVRALHLDVTGLTDVAWRPLADALSSRAPLDVLGLSRTALTDRARPVTVSRALGLSHTALGGDGARAWLDAHRDAPLRAVALADVGLTAQGVASVTEALEALPALAGLVVGEGDPPVDAALRAWVARGAKLDALSVHTAGELAPWVDAVASTRLRALELRGAPWHDALVALVRAHPTLRALSVDARGWELRHWRAFTAAARDGRLGALRTLAPAPEAVREELLAAITRAPSPRVAALDDLVALRASRVPADGTWLGLAPHARPRERPRRAVPDDALALALDTLREVSRAGSARDGDDPVLASLREAARALLTVDRPRPPPARPRATPAAQAPAQRYEVADPVDAPPPWRCYVCRHTIRAQHPRYPRMCLACGELNEARRARSVDLAGRTFVLTGARVGIGHAAALRLLRAGAAVVATTRFPHDALRCFDAQPDAEQWRQRLTVHGIDLRHLPAVERFGHHLVDTLDRLDGVIHNAAQTVWLPPSAYEPLAALEGAAPASLPGAWRRSLGMRFSEPDALLPGRSSDALALRDDPMVNSWRLRLGEIPMRELVEVQAVNAIAPAVLSNALRPLMERPPTVDRWLIFVSAPEGQFGYRKKSVRHPHTNMAKAAVNMLVRTAAPDWARSRVWMTAVDPGWVSNQNPRAMAEAQAARGLVLPLDVEDGAARVVDPIERAVATGENLYGVLLKDYKPAPW